MFVFKVGKKLSIMGMFKVVNDSGDNTTRQQNINIENHSDNNKHRRGW
jgi:hypothetical protein